MQETKVNLQQRFFWLVKGWRIFTKHPATWMAMSLVYACIVGSVLLIPVVGTLVFAMIWPALTAGLVYGAHRVSQGSQLKISYLFECFRLRGLRGSLLVIGLLLAGLVIAHTGLSMLLWSHGIDDTTFLEVTAIMSTIITGIVLFYSIPCVVIGKATPWKAIKEGVLTAVEHKSKILLFGISYLTLLIIALLPHGLGLLVLLPVTAGAVHTYYSQSYSEYDTRTRKHGLYTCRQP